MSWHNGTMGSLSLRPVGFNGGICGKECLEECSDRSARLQVSECSGYNFFQRG